MPHIVNYFFVACQQEGSWNAAAWRS